MPHTSVTVFLPAGPEQDARYVGAGILVDPRLVVLTAPPTRPLAPDQKVRVHLQAPGVGPQLARGTALPTAYDGLVLVQFARPVAAELPLERLPRRLTTATSAETVATLLRERLASGPVDDDATGTEAIDTQAIDTQAIDTQAIDTGPRAAGTGGKPWWCWISSNGPGCR